MSQCTIEKIFYYPVKGCRAVEVEQAELSETGIAGDRAYVILYDGGFGNLKTLPALARVTVNLTEGGLRFSAEGSDDYHHEHRLAGDETNLTFYADQVPVVDQGDAVATWLQEVTGAEVRLATLKQDFNRNLPLDSLKAADGVLQNGFCDLSPIMLVNAATLDDVNSKLDEPVPVERFRCNIVVSGLKPYAEDEITKLDGDGLSLAHVVGCERCVIVNTDPTTGEMGSKEPLNLLNGYRRIKDGYASGILFGSYFNVTGQKTVAVGDRFAVTNT